MEPAPAPPPAAPAVLPPGRPSARRSVLSLVAGSAVGVGLTYLAQPVLTRLFTAAEFGTADLFAAVVSVLYPVASLRYEDALTLPEDDADAAHLFWLATALSLGAAALLMLAVWAQPLVEADAGFRGLAPLLVWLGPCLLALRALRLTEAWLTRTKGFGPLSTASAVRAGATSAFRLGAGFAGGGAGGLVHGFVAGTAVGAAVQAAPLLRTPGALAAQLEWGRLRAVAVRYRRFALLTTPAALLNNLAGRVPFLLLAVLFNASVVGLFGRVFLVLAVPLGLVGGAVSRVFTAHAAQARREGTLAPVAARFHERLVVLGFFPTAALCAFGPDLFACVFGEPWREAGVYAQVLAPWLFLAAVVSPLSTLFDVTEQHRLDLLMGAALFVGQTAALWMGSLSGSARLALAAAGASGFLFRSVQLRLMLGAADVPARAVLAPYLREAARSLPGLSLAAVCALPGRPLLTTTGVALGAAVHYGAHAWRERRAPAPPEGDGR